MQCDKDKRFMLAIYILPVGIDKLEVSGDVLRG
jgi:hypothetical protein